ncbi:hypothetical protein PAMA_008904 [Pampus argenteus]
MSVLLTSTHGLNLTIPSSEYQVALGQDISLRCYFTLDPVDVGSLEIEWTINRSEYEFRVEYVIHHFLGFEGRVYFSHTDLQDGDVSLTIKRVKIIDNGTYHCTVKKGWEIQSRQIKLMVMEEESVPVHGSNRGTESEVDLKLRNRSSLVTTFPANYSLLTSTKTSASTQDDWSSQGNAKNTTGTTKGTTSVITTETITGTTTVVTTGTITGTYRDFGMVHDIAETPTVDLSLTTESQNTSSSSSTSQDRGVSIGVAATFTIIIMILAGKIFWSWIRKRQQKSEENVSADEANLVHTQDTYIGFEGEDSTEEVPETQNVDFEGVQVMGASLPEMSSL